MKQLKLFIINTPSQWVSVFVAIIRDGTLRVCSLEESGSAVEKDTKQGGLLISKIGKESQNHLPEQVATPRLRLNERMKTAPGYVHNSMPGTITL